MPFESTVGTHGLGAFGESRREATVGVLAGRNPALPGLPLQGPGCLWKISPTKKKKKKKIVIIDHTQNIVYCRPRRKDYFSKKDTCF